MSRVLIIGDIHEPVSHPGYLSFCRDLRDRHKCDEIVFIGDIVDHHAVSFHAHHPDAPGPKDEAELTQLGIDRWSEEFPDAKVCIGNHDERIVLLAESVNIPKKFLRTYAESWHTPGWDWQPEHTIDDTYLFHGTAHSGMHPAFNAMKKMAMSVAMGHCHSAGGIKWMVNPTRRFFALDTGCGIDDKAVAFAYGRHNKTRSVLSAGVILDGVPYHEIMQIGPGEKYNRRRFGRKGFHSAKPKNGKKNA
jgi:predicted phosphodiesterase